MFVVQFLRDGNEMKSKEWLLTKKIAV